MKKILRYAFCGGPASGKSSTLKILSELPRNSNVGFAYVKEVASEFFRDRPDLINDLDKDPSLRQFYIYRTQKLLEDTVSEFAEKSPLPVVILFDRGRPDLFVYTESEKALDFISDEELSEFKTCYDRVFYFEGDENRNFTSDSDTPRLEKDAMQAHTVSTKTKSIWESFYSDDRFITIPQCATVEDKAMLVARIINEIAGEEFFIL